MVDDRVVKFGQQRQHHGASGAQPAAARCISETSAASSEQSKGTGQIGEAVSQLDQVTHQNAALVKECAAAAESMRGQAAQLAGTVAVFKLDAVDAATRVTRPRPEAPATAAAADEDWASF